jgi:tetraacyldisaccharide 4'-kinase
MMKLLRKLLLPIVPFYYAITWLRNKGYDWGWKTSKSYDLPVICVGNLSTGGTGKTPMIEFLIRLLKTDYSVATLSRGYKRETSGFVLASENASARTLGDEPFQFYLKFKDITVSVDANRQNGIERLTKLKQPDVILLDDAFQHRKVTAGYNILLTGFGSLYSDDIVLPAGNLREPRSGAKRANMIVVTKCPPNLSEIKKQEIIAALKPSIEQKVFFSSINYSEAIYNEVGSKAFKQLKNKKVTVVTGIANPDPFLNFLRSEQIDFEHLNFKDHHVFTAEEIAVLKQKQCILSTEKDYVRLKPHFASTPEQLYYLPIFFEIDRAEAFERCIKQFVKPR